MKSRLSAKFCSLLILFLLAACPVLAGDTLFQYSTFDALLAGLYEGGLTMAELKKRGDFGLGTFNNLDGEMVVLGGKVYQLKTDGKVYPVADTMKTPLAAVTFFKADQTLPLPKAGSFNEMTVLLNQALPSGNLFFAVKIEGRFKEVKVRSVPRQTPPYQPLVQVVKKQAVFPLKEVEGTLVGFYCPAYLKTVGVPGWHFHFLTKDRTRGGHVQDLALENLTAQIDILPGFSLLLPQNQEFYQADLTKDRLHEAEKVEK
jgi:acetolactate decarboxylase